MGRWGARWVGLAVGIALTACGGGSGGAGGEAAAPEMPASREAAARFLAQASFGPTEASIDRVMALGYGAWIDEQFAKPASSHRATWEASDAAVKAANPTGSAGQDGTLNAFWQAAVSGEDQLRQRVAYALSQIMVISMQDNAVGDNPRAVAAYLDTLADKGLGNYRDLLEAVSLHPMMGVYLSHLRNQKADPRTGRVPDENFAREVMQLFSIGLHELAPDGSVRLANGVPVETYGPADIGGLARVFTGWSWACPDWPDNACFTSGAVGGVSDPDRAFKPLMGYPQFHATEAKAFLGTTIAAQSPADPQASLRAALDTLYRHPNVGPFIGRQLIQRLVTSNPSPAYVSAVAAAFADNGGGVRGDLKHVVKTILMHPEARTVGERSGKVREPVLRLSALLRAFGYRSDSGQYRVGNTDNPGTSLGQTPLRAPSVFNFYRPGYVAPGTAAAAAGLVAPEMQILHETTAAGYVNTMRDAVSLGVGSYNSTLARRDLQPDFTAELALADQPAALVARVGAKLIHGAVPAALASEVEGAVASIAIPAPSGSNQAQIDAARRNRVNAAVFLTLVAPEFIVAK
ncbi:MAG TPA: DUF1800 domain-containing protein [Burkholderiaceae bacterium]|nr:DUF1800 domain-containing protein [Burkholderiaceae bacterium]